MKLKMPIMKILLLGTVAIISVNSMSGMEEAQVVEDVVTLKSQDEVEFTLSQELAKLSGTLKDAFEDIVPGQVISLPKISGKTLETFITLLEGLSPLVEQNEKAAEPDKIYIPRAYQDTVTTAVKDLPNKELGDLFRAANYLNVPLMLNGLASVIADRIHTKVSLKKQVGNKEVSKDLDKQRAAIKDALKKEGFGEVLKGPDMYILKHVTFRKRYIKKEYSIADYAKDDGLPEGVEISFPKKGLTSLFGIKRLKKPDSIKELYLGNNCFFSFALDVQGVENPFEDFGRLEELSLDRNRLVKLPEGLFKGLGELERLYLWDNQLVKLPEGLFKGLGKLKSILLYGNKLVEESKQQLKKALPNTKIT